ncbi:MAG: CaiB/BaiF CoA-transferase family protein [Alphaproteobacteria bacterium]|nr:CaiB/BaiF CoA-transferase family protein [Alphaproteobacteria bacterium]MDP6591155.1 CaiB/BaiF CoA-transferase family protein [Alphaproteobacteria bacterium]MDP6816951.1 CaiB/BaiF CoA-transferase family protein [Alphaproteobacteria bacterium]
MKLTGIKVLDLSRFLPGPHLAMMMADHGAEVIKIEDTKSGDPARHIGPKSGDQTVYYRNANRGKKSLSLDLKSADGRELFLRLAEGADVVLETFRPGVVDRLGIGYDVVAARAPQVVYCSISAFGQDGPYRDRPAHDLSVCALAGVASLSVDRDGQPNMPCMPPSDMGGSLMAFAGILMALVGRAQTGKGDYLDMSMYDSVISWTPHIAGKVLAEGRAPEPLSERTQGGAAFYRPYAVKGGGHITLGGSEMKFVSNFLTAMGREDLIEVAKLPPGEPQADLRDYLSETFLTKTRDEWSAWFKGRDICFAPVLDLVEAFENEHLLARDMLLRDADGNAHLGIPIKFRREPGEVNMQAPALGADSEEIALGLGLGPDEVARLKDKGVLRTG